MNALHALEVLHLQAGHGWPFEMHAAWRMRRHFRVDVMWSHVMCFMLGYTSTPGSVTWSMDSTVPGREGTLPCFIEQQEEIGSRRFGAGCSMLHVARSSFLHYTQRLFYLCCFPANGAHCAQGPFRADTFPSWQFISAFKSCSEASARPWSRMCSVLGIVTGEGPGPSGLWKSPFNFLSWNVRTTTLAASARLCHLRTFCILMLRGSE